MLRARTTDLPRWFGTEFLSRRMRLLGGTALVVAALAGGLVWWTRPPTAAITTAQVLALLPAGSTLHSLARFDLDGAAPLEAAAVVGVPRFPGAAVPGYLDVIVRYDRWRRRLAMLYQKPVMGSIPISVDAGRILGDSDGAVFQALRDDGRWSYTVVGMSAGRVEALAVGDSAERIALSDPLVILRGERQALQWAGTRFAGRPLPATTPIPGSVTWRFALRAGVVSARTNQVVLQPRQVLRVQPVGGGTTPIVIADPRLDVVENGFRARAAGTYSIRVLAPSTPPENSYVLTVIVSATRP